ncbi:ParA family protein [Ruegeria marina]|uniref:Chromosome partitioning protein n=1 Tax=Ruegeria marina TaxID=639004 RepID=A0A1G6JH71_9RHOB|nr:AAA family ATPase [Ruegeria marina]SDC18089.1 chromosome partitioning protein [Ruegeria marina]
MQVIACYSNKGGVGKTATSVNLAHAIARSGRQVLLCDLDPQGASTYYFRVKPSKKLSETKFFEDVDRFADAIRASDFEGLDILPANRSFRDFDRFLSRIRNKRSRLTRALAAGGAEYDVVVLDCPPNFSLLSENVFRAADRIVVPVPPSTLSERTFEQLVAFFKDQRLPRQKISAFFSMVERRKTLHRETMERMRATHPKRFLEAAIPYSADVERMGLRRAPVAEFAPRSAAASAYAALYRELGL